MSLRERGRLEPRLVSRVGDQRERLSELERVGGVHVVARLGGLDTG
jgi:hypothetical protein